MSVLLRTLPQTIKLSNISKKTLRFISCSSALQRYWEPDKKGGRYKKEIVYPHTERVKDGLRDMKGEMRKFRDEWVTKFRCDSVMLTTHGDYEIVWRFNDQQTVDTWSVTSDSDHNEGKSRASFTLGADQRALFSGQLNTEVPKDGIIKSAGYCNIRSPKNLISFRRQRAYDWIDYTHLLIGLKGDGRVYQLIIHMDRYFDVQWNDQYNYPLYTRGGPYWQIAKIPFSKFLLSAKGRVQDKQQGIQLDRVESIGITLADAIPGPFSLQLDFIGLIYDQNHIDTFEYEMFPVSIAVHS